MVGLMLASKLNTVILSLGVGTILEGVNFISFSPSIFQDIILSEGRSNYPKWIAQPNKTLRDCHAL